MQGANRLTAAVAVLCLVQFVDVLGVTSAVVAIPAMLDGVGAGDAAAGPVATAYAMFFGGLLVVGARLGDRFGHVRLLLTGLVVFAVAGGVGAASGHAWQLVAARSVQGVASALTVPAALTLLLATATAPAQRARALGAWSAAGAVAGATGLFAGGLLTELLGWRAIFWVNVPLALGLAAGVLACTTARPPTDPATHLDLVGALLLVTTVMALVLGSSFLEGPSTRTRGLFVLGLGAALAAALVLRLRATAHPLIPLAALRRPTLVVGTLGSFVNTAASSSTAVLLTLHLQREGGFNAFQAGLTLLPLSGAVVVGAALASPVASRGGTTSMTTWGLGLMGSGNVVIAAVLLSTPDSAPGLGPAVIGPVVLGLVLLGSGLGLASVGANDLGTRVPEGDVGTATGVLNTAAQLGTAFGVAALLLVASAGSYRSLSAEGVAVAGAGTLALTATGALLTRGRPRR